MWSIPLSTLSASRDSQNSSNRRSVTSIPSGERKRTSAASLRSSANRISAPRFSKRVSRLGDSLRDNFEFTDESLRRATRVSHVLRCCGQILKSNDGTASTYSLSEGVAHIDGFLSHNWKTPPLGKFLAFALYYNLYWAAVATLSIVAAAVALLAHVDYLPIVDVADTSYGRIGAICTPFATPLFFLILLIFRDICHCMGYYGPTCFLDKICIHQEDPVLKRKGIASLGAFLCDSQSMLIAYTDLYLRQLWTVFELGTFLILRSSDDMVLLPPLAAKLTCASSIVWYASVFVYVLYTMLEARISTLNREAKFAIVSIIGVAGLVGISIGLRRLARAREESLSQALTFRCVAAKCFCESDRPLVNGIIVSLMRELGYVEKQASGARSLQEFDKLVHKAVPNALHDAFPATGLPYSHVLVAVQTTFWLQCDRILGFWHDGHGVDFLCAHAMLATTLYFTVLPSLVALMFFLSTRQLQAHGWREAVVLAFVPIICAPVWAVITTVCIPLAVDLVGNNARLALTIFAPCEFFLALLVFALFRSRRHSVPIDIVVQADEDEATDVDDVLNDAEEPLFEIVPSCVSHVMVVSQQNRTSKRASAASHSASASRISLNGTVRRPSATPSEGSIDSGHSSITIRSSRSRLTVPTNLVLAPILPNGSLPRGSGSGSIGSGSILNVIAFGSPRHSRVSSPEAASSATRSSPEYEGGGPAERPDSPSSVDTPRCEVGRGPSMRSM